MTKLRGVIVSVLLLAGFAFAAKIKADFDKTANFSDYKTYAWGNSVDPHRQGAKIFIVGAITEEMMARGLQQTDVEHADIIIRYQAASDTDLNVGATTDPTYASIGGVPLDTASVWSTAFPGGSSGRYLRKGTLVIDIFDVHQRKLIWSVMATDTFKDKTEKAVKQLGNIISSMFEQYPVKRKS